MKRHWRHAGIGLLALCAAVAAVGRAQPARAQTLAQTSAQTSAHTTGHTTAGPVDGIVISLADRRLYALRGDQPPRSYPVAIGRPGVAIPLGDSTVVRKRRDPTWRPTANQRRERPWLPAAVPPGPDNPLGRFALDLGWSAIAIHGTNEPASVGRRASSGCFRMMPADIEALFPAVPPGTPVRVIQGAFVPGARPDVGQPAAVRPQPVAVSVVAAPRPPPQPVAAPPPLTAVARPVAAAVTPIPDPRCPSSTAPLRRLLCDTPELAALDGRARGLARARMAAAALDEERRFDERIAARCWVRRGTEVDPAVAAEARGCLRSALIERLRDIEGDATR